jgi:hypothetical protein
MQMLFDGAPEVLAIYGRGRRSFLKHPDCGHEGTPSGVAFFQKARIRDESCAGPFRRGLSRLAARTLTQHPWQMASGTLVPEEAHHCRL